MVSVLRCALMLHLAFFATACFIELDLLEGSGADTGPADADRDDAGPWDTDTRDTDPADVDSDDADSPDADTADADSDEEVDAESPDVDTEDADSEVDGPDGDVDADPDEEADVTDTDVDTDDDVDADDGDADADDGDVDADTDHDVDADTDVPDGGPLSCDGEVTEPIVCLGSAEGPAQTELLIPVFLGVPIVCEGTNILSGAIQLPGELFSLANPSSEGCIRRVQEGEHILWTRLSRTVEPSCSPILVPGLQDLVRVQVGGALPGTYLLRWTMVLIGDETSPANCRGEIGVDGVITIGE